MDVFWPVVWGRIHRDKIRIQGSPRTKRLRKKRYKHLNSLYEHYRDEVWIEDRGMTFLQWRQYRKSQKRRKPPCPDRTARHPSAQ